MAGKRKPRGTSRGRRRRSHQGRNLSRFLWRWLGLILFGGLLVAILYVLYLDQTVRSRFEGKRWALPARVYARPLELYAGKPLTADAFEQALRRLDYSRVRHPDHPGAYSRNRSRFLLRTRAFRFWDGREPSRYLELKFGDGRVATIRNGSGGASVALARLDAQLIASISPADNEDRVLVSRQDLPELLVATLLAVEDRNFLSHHGVDPLAILRALWQDLRAGRLVQGGSTLTQQLVKNLYLNRKRTLWRKVNEAVMALLLDWHYSKDEILTAYVNEIFLGQQGRRAIHGFGLASRFYFNRDLEDLDLPRIALLVGLIKGPSYYEPRRHPQRARRRRNLVLEVLARQGVVSKVQAATATKVALGVTAAGGRPTGSDPAFLQLVRRQLRRDYREQDLRSEGLRIFTTLDPRVQDVSQRALAERLQRLEKRHGQPQGRLQGAVVVVSSEGGEVLAVVGGRRAGYAGFNRALDALRPIGSLIKPVVYLTALERPAEYNLVTPLDDSPVTLKGRDGKRWQPRNYDRKSHGRVPLYQALAHSYNQATVRLGMTLGPPAIAAQLRALGVERPLPTVPAMLLGAVALSPLEVAQLYQTFAAGGFRAPLRAVLEVLDSHGRPLNRYPLTVRQVADPGPIYLLDWALRQVVQEGTARSLAKRLAAGLAVAGKTGTTNDLRDSWFAGFSGNRVAVVWVGRDDNQPAGLTGASGALRVWADIMGTGDNVPFQPLVPEGVGSLWIEAGTGKRADRQCAGARLVPFLRGSAPRAVAACARAEKPSGFDFLRRLFE